MAVEQDTVEEILRTLQEQSENMASMSGSLSAIRDYIQTASTQTATTQTQETEEGKEQESPGEELTSAITGGLDMLSSALTEEIKNFSTELANVVAKEINRGVRGDVKATENVADITAKYAQFGVEVSEKQQATWLQQEQLREQRELKARQSVERIGVRSENFAVAAVEHLSGIDLTSMAQQIGQYLSDERYNVGKDLQRGRIKRALGEGDGNIMSNNAGFFGIGSSATGDGE